ncbi:hypothetical protein SCR05_09345 [Streptococcus canis]|uniref:zinc ribbon domain-containing protein n=1 Tax=Streptococcus canis TaxID=1329 RepID=UPI00298DB3A6|nr:hypothetical protein [Streptococcus canis]MDW7797748.1 hypothetical protein [Streptococcus canis]
MTKLFHNQTFNKIVLVVGSCCLLLLIFGAFHYSKANRINTYLKARSVPSGRVFENIKEYLVWADTKEQITNDEAKFTDFRRYSQRELAQKAKELKEAGPDSAIQVKSVGRRFLIFPDYRIAIKPMDLTLKTNVPQMDLLLNHKKVAVSDSEDFSVKLDRLPMADYTASINGTHNGRKIKVNKAYDGENRVLDLSVTFKTFTVTSNVKEGDLYFEDNRVGTLKEGHFQVEDYPVTDSAKAYIKKTFPDGDLKSRKYALADVTDGDNLEITIDHLLGEEKAGQLLVSAFDQLIHYLSTGQDAANLGSVFEAGASNAFYRGLKESIQAKFQTDVRKASSLNIPSILLTKMTQVGKESYLLDFAATYEFMYDRSTDPAKQTSGHISQELTGKMTLKKVGDHYLISQTGTKNITVASEQNQVKVPSVFPENFLGTWVGQTNDLSVEMTLAEDGSVTTKVVIKNGHRSETKTAKITKVEDKGDGLYLYTADPSSNLGALTPGTGLGGVNVKYAYGFKVSGNTATPLVWQAGANSDFDYSKPLAGITLKKQ